MEEYIKHFRAMDGECFTYCAHIGYFRAVLENDDFFEGIDNASNSIVLRLGSREIICGLIMFCSRMLDEGKDASCLRRLSADPSPDDIARHHYERKISDFPSMLMKSSISLKHATVLKFIGASSRNCTRSQKSRTTVTQDSLIC